MELRPGLKLKSSVCSTEIIVVSGSGDVDMTCGGVPMVEPSADPAPGEAVEGLTAGTLLGKRYADADGTLEVLCTKPGDGSIGIGSVALDLKQVTALPASD